MSSKAVVTAEGMDHLRQVLGEIGLSSLAELFASAGFWTWESLREITEQELESLDVKLGHRRKLQRRIATERGIPAHVPLNLGND